MTVHEQLDGTIAQKFACFDFYMNVSVFNGWYSTKSRLALLRALLIFAHAIRVYRCIILCFMDDSVKTESCPVALLRKLIDRAFVRKSCLSGFAIPTRVLLCICLFWYDFRIEQKYEFYKLFHEWNIRFKNTKTHKPWKTWQSCKTRNYRSYR